MPAVPIPTVEEYQAELKPFTDAGWEVRFSTPRGSFACMLRANHPRMGLQIDMHVDVEARKSPELMRDYLHEVWTEVEKEVEKKFGFPQMRIYTTSTWAHQPKNWQDYAAILSLSPDRIDLLRKDLESAYFRRMHHIVLASPFKDVTGQLVYELEVVNVPWGKLVMQFDEMGGAWSMLDLEKNLTYSPSAAANGYREGRISDAFRGMSSLGPI